jgi:hypothetical protein
VRYNGLVKRFRRWLFSGLLLISSVLCITTICFWIRSVNSDLVSWYQKPRDLEIRSDRGLLQIVYGTLSSQNYPPAAGWKMSLWPFQLEDFYDFSLGQGTTLGFGYERWQMNRSGLIGDSRIVTFPFWLPTLFFSLLPALSATRSIRRKYSERSDGKCSNCGYDLRATPDQCPECGAIPSKK